MRFDYDVVVVGGGPAGSTAARFCAQAGLRTLLIEKERFPRYKACGGCLSVKAAALLDFDLSSVVERTITGAKFTYCLKDPFFIGSQEPIGFMVMRDRFDQLLVRRALEEGVEMAEGARVVQVQEMEGGLEVEWGKGERLGCAYLIGADGTGSVVSRSFAPLKPKNDEDGFGLESEVPFEAVSDFSSEDLQNVHLDFGRIPSGYAWIFPKKEGLSIGIGGVFKAGEKSKPRHYFNTFIKDLGFVNEEKMGRVVGHPLPCFYDENKKISHRTVFLVGDAGYLMDPLTGEGIYYAIRSGQLAAETIRQSRENGMEPASAYEHSVRNLLLDDLKWARHVSQIIYRFTKLSYRTLKLYPELGQLCLGVLAGGTSYRSFVVKVKERMQGLVKGHVGEKIKKAIARPCPVISR